ncbi:MAG TPA: hypothetical protein VF544_21415 [Pyrinomonadaceae bacterium]
MQTSRPFARWKLGLLAALAVTLLALYPQLNLWYARGAEWQGSYAHIDSDEVAYAAYLAALVDGRERRNDPYTGRDDAEGAPQHESLFSIQFVQPLAIAAVARTLGIPAPVVFMLLLPLCAFCASLAIFWLMLLLTDDEWLAATAVPVVLCLGTFGPVYIAWQALRGMDLTFAFSFLPFLRRFQPAVSFPFFFLFCACVWRALRALERETIFGQRADSRRWAVAACLIFALLVFSYFYLWTAALAWTACLLLSLAAFRPAGWRRDLRFLGLILVACSLALIPYYLLLRNRAPAMDGTQLLAHSRRPDLLHWSEIIGLVVVAALLWAHSRAPLAPRRRVTVFAASFALLPLVVFNQQVVTGHSLQPLHYDLFIAKHAALIALLLGIALIHRGRRPSARRIPAQVLFWIALASLGWGWIEATVATRRYLPVNISLDRSRPAALRLAELARAEGLNRPLTLSTDLVLADSLPAQARLAVLWAPHLQVFSGSDAAEHRERVYQYLYYTGVRYGPGDEYAFERLDPEKRYFINTLVGWGRNDAAWNVSWRPLTPADIETELRGYREYAASFNRDRAARPTLSYLVLPAWQRPDLSNLDRWYERDAGERAGDFIIYRLRLRP